MQHTTRLALLATLLHSACDPADTGTSLVDPAAEPTEAPSPVIHYSGQRFTLDELGEAPPYLVARANGEVHGFDTETEADEFVRLHARPAELSAAIHPVAAELVNCYRDVDWGQKGTLYAPGTVTYLGDNGWNDVISSIQNHTSRTVKFYPHANFGGNPFTFEPWSEVRDLRPYGWNDVISSYFAE
jgi:hypothetical protein